MMKNKWARRALPLLVGVASLFVVAPAGAAPVPNYTSTGGSTNAPGFSGTPCADQTVPPTGGAVTCTVDGYTITVTLPANAAGGDSLEIIITLSQTGGVVIPVAKPGYDIVLLAGISIIDVATGQKFTGTLNPLVTVTVTNPTIASSDQVATYQQGAWTNGLSVTISNGSFSIPITSDPDIALLAPATASGTPIAGATVAATGVPVRGDLILGSGLVLLGLAGVAFVVRRRLAR